MTSVADNVDICVACVHDKPPSFPLKEELVTLGVELVYNARGTGNRAIEHETQKAVKEFRRRERERERQKLRLLPMSKKKMLRKEEERKKREKEIRDHPQSLSYSNYKRTLYHVESSDSGSVSSWTDSGDSVPSEKSNQKNKRIGRTKRRSTESGDLPWFAASRQAAKEGKNAISGTEMHAIEINSNDNTAKRVALATGGAMTLSSFSTHPFDQNEGRRLESLDMSSSDSDDHSISMSSDTMPMTETTFHSPSEPGSLEIALLQPSTGKWIHEDERDVAHRVAGPVGTKEDARSTSSTNAVMGETDNDSSAFTQPPEVPLLAWSPNPTVSADYSSSNEAPEVNPTGSEQSMLDETTYRSPTNTLDATIAIADTAVGMVVVGGAALRTTDKKEAEEAPQNEWKAVNEEEFSSVTHTSQFDNECMLDNVTLESNGVGSQDQDALNVCSQTSDLPVDKKPDGASLPCPAPTGGQEYASDIMVQCYIAEKDHVGSHLNRQSNQVSYKKENESDSFAGFESETEGGSEENLFGSTRAATSDQTAIQMFHAALSDTRLDEFEVVAELEGSPMLSLSPSSSDGRLALHVACDRQFPTRSLGVDSDQLSMLEDLIEDAYARRELIECIVESHPAACLFSDKHGDLPVHIVARRLLQWEAVWRKELWSSGIDVGMNSLNIKQLQTVIAQIVDVLLRPTASVGSLCRSRGKMGRLLPLHIAALFPVPYDTLRLLLETNPVAAEIPCDFSGMEACSVEAAMPLELMERTRKLCYKPFPGLEDSPQGELYNSEDNTLADDLTGHSELLFAFNPGVLPFRKEPMRIQRLECLIRDNVKRVAEGGGFEDFDNAVRSAWTWMCTFDDGVDADDTYISSIVSIVNALPVDAVQVLASMRSREGDLILSLALPPCAKVILKRLNRDSTNEPSDSLLQSRFPCNGNSLRSSESLGEDASTKHSLTGSISDSSTPYDEDTEVRDDSSARRPPTHRPPRFDRSFESSVPSAMQESDGDLQGSSSTSSNPNLAEYDANHMDPLKAAFEGKVPILKHTRTMLSAIVDDCHGSSKKRSVNALGGETPTNEIDMARQDVLTDEDDELSFDNPPEETSHSLLQRMCALEERLLRREIDMAQLKLATHAFELRIMSTAIDKHADENSIDEHENTSVRSQTNSNNSDITQLGDIEDTVDMLSAVASHIEMTDEESGMRSDSSGIYRFRDEHSVSPEIIVEGPNGKVPQESSGIACREESCGAKGALVGENRSEPMTRQPSGILEYRQGHPASDEEEMEARAKEMTLDAMEFWMSMHRAQRPTRSATKS